MKQHEFPDSGGNKDSYTSCETIILLSIGETTVNQ